jgi:hypothetical protein
MRFARAAYRPFQTDASWEHPFTRRTLERLARHFRIERVRGVMGPTMPALLLSFVPGMGRVALRLGRRAAARENRVYSRIERRLLSCLHISLLMRRT